MTPLAQQNEVRLALEDRPLRSIGDEPCVVHIKVVGRIEYLDGNGQVIESVNAETQRALYLAWCREHGVHPASQILG